MNVSLRHAAAASAVSLLAVLPLASAANGATTHPQRQLAVTTLPDFRVVLTATRSNTGPYSATVTAAGYRPAARGWRLIAVKRIGAAGQWGWYSTGVCSFTVTQSKPSPPPGSPSIVPWDSVTVSLSYDPAIGCVPPVTKHWR
jgi:hypothetical protein